MLENRPQGALCWRCTRRGRCVGGPPAGGTVRGAVLEDRLQGALLGALCWRTACRGRCYKGCVGGPPVGGAVRGAVLEDRPQGALCWRPTCRGRCSAGRRSVAQQRRGVTVTIDDPVRAAPRPSPPRARPTPIVHLCNLVSPQPP